MNVALRPAPADAFNFISLCTGGGGLDLGLELAIPSARPVLLVEREAFAVAHLVAAMQAGLLADAPVWSDVRTLNGRPWRGLVDGLIGGIPCQPHSQAGKRQGSLDERDLWSPTRRIIAQARPWFVLIENVSGMLTAGADDIPGAQRVIGDLRRLGYAVEAGLFTAAEVDDTQERKRCFILALANRYGARLESGFRPPLAHARADAVKQSGSLGCGARERRRRLSDLRSDRQADANLGRPGPLFPPGPEDHDIWDSILEQSPGLEPAVCRMADGLAHRVDRLRLLGNGVVPLQAAYAIRSLLAAHTAAGTLQADEFALGSLPA